MIKKSAHRDALLADVFSHDDFATGPAAQFAQLAARHARRRRLARNIVLTTTTGAGLAAAFTFTLFHAPASVTSPARVPSPKPAYEIISDAQLLALVTDRPLLVVTNDHGPSQIVLIEE